MSAPLQDITRTTLLPYVEAPLPAPGRGRTGARWSALRRLARVDLPLVKLVEPHHDAAAILEELGGDPPLAGEIWAVWAAEPPFAVLRAHLTPDGWRLSGTKAFCSGAGIVSHALVTARAEDGDRLLAVELASPGISLGDGPPWEGVGMARAATETLAFDDVPAVAIGEPSAYVERSGFWFGAIGIAACWFGGAQGVADTLEAAATRLDPHGLAHLGAVRADLDSYGLGLDAAARQVDAEGFRGEDAERLALVLRARCADVVEHVVSHVAKALGPGPLAFDAEHAARVADLQVFVRQHHAERDLARLGALGSRA